MGHRQEALHRHLARGKAALMRARQRGSRDGGEQSPDPSTVDVLVLVCWFNP
jgi:hypothetical protein